MTYEEERVVSSEPVERVETVNTQPAVETVRTTPAVESVPATAPVEEVRAAPSTVVEQRAPARRTVVTEDPVGNAFAASRLIETIVWSVVVLVLLAVALMALHVYAHLF